jgi:hypothetical protein
MCFYDALQFYGIIFYIAQSVTRGLVTVRYIVVRRNISFIVDSNKCVQKII